MSRTPEATFDGEALIPAEPLDPEPNSRVRVNRTEQPQHSSRSNGSLAELFGSVDFGYPTGADNGSIDSDLVCEYASTHEE